MYPTLIFALAYSLGAGFMNGSFALPTKYIKSWDFENIWLIYAIWAFLILPWVTVFALSPSIGQVYAAMPTRDLLILLAGGFLFGTGQVCFALALRYIGLGSGFTINIGLAAGLGSLLPLITLNAKNVLTPAGLITIGGVAFIIVGLILSFQAGQQRDKSTLTSNHMPNNRYYLGVFLAIAAGLFSAGQNYTFALTSHLAQNALANGVDSLAASIIIWPPFLTCSLIPYALYMIYLQVKNNSFQRYRDSAFLRNSILGIVMALFWFGSLAIYSKASLLIGKLGPVVAWPLFMVLIIMTSNFWSWRHKEWEGCDVLVKKRALLAIGALIFAVILLASSAGLSLS